MKNIGILIIEKTGKIKTLCIKDYKEDELYKKCGFTKSDDFIKHAVWNKKVDNISYNISVFGKIKGKANYENKYEFPPPIDNHLFFGSCAVVCKKNNEYTSITIELWNKIYEKLFGGFEDLSKMAKEDEEEEDELDKIPNHKKTKNGGYLKDGFVVDDSSSSEITSVSENEDDEDESEEEDEEIIIPNKIKPKQKTKTKIIVEKEEEEIVDISTELIEEEFSDEEQVIK